MFEHLKMLSFFTFLHTPLMTEYMLLVFAHQNLTSTCDSWFS